MARRSLLFVTVLAAALATNGRSAATHDDDDRRDGKKRDLKATLSGYNETPSTLSTPGRGSFRGRISRSGDRIDWKLEYRDVPTNVMQAHIHFGDHHTTGGISVFLCTNLGNGPAGTELCPNDVDEKNSVSGTATAADVIGPAGQGIAAGEFDELIQAIKSRRTYVNVHSVAFPGGEIRGQIRVDD